MSLSILESVSFVHHYFRTLRVYADLKRVIGTTSRTTSSSNEEMALSCTFHLDRKLSLGLAFGCTEEKRRELIKKLKRTSREHFHPLVMAGIFFELERERLEECVDQLLDDFALNSSEISPLDLSMGKREMIGYLKKCYRSRELGNEINSLKRQLKRLIDEITVLDETIEIHIQKDKCSEVAAQHGQQQLKRAGRRIKGRLEEMCDVLDDKIDSCNVTIENMSLTMQTVSTETL